MLGRSYSRAWTACVLMCASAVALGSEHQERSFGVVPQGSPYALAKIWQPLIRQLTRPTDHRLRFQTAPSITRFQQRVLKGEYDYVYLNSLAYLEAHRKQGYQALVRQTNPVQGILVVRKDSPLTVSRLRGKTVAFPSPQALGATLLTRAELKKRGIGYSVSYVGTHQSAYQGVLLGRYAAAGGITRTLNMLPTEKRDQLRILLTTPEVTGHVIAVHPRVPAAERQRVTQTLTSLHKTVQGSKLLGGLRIDRFVAAKATDFRQVARLKPPRTQDLGQLYFHVIPRLSQDSTKRQMTPLVSHIRQHLELEFQLQTYPTMEAFEQAIYASKGHALVNANPMQALKLVEQGYEIIAQQTPVNSPDGMHTVILVREDSPYRKLADLKGKRVAFGGSPNAFFSNVVPRVMFDHAGLTGRFTDATRPGPISDVVKRLRAGEIDAAGTGSLARNSAVLSEKYGVDRMRVIARSEAMPGLTWLVSKDIPQETRDDIRRLLLRYDTDAPGSQSMNAAGIAGLHPATLATYKSVRKYLKAASRLK